MLNENLAQSLDASVSWIVQNIDQFSFDVDENTDRQILLLKPFSELLLALHFLQRNAADRFSFREHFGWAWDKIEQGEFFLRVLVARPDFYQLILPIAYFTLNGFRNERLISLVSEFPKLRAFMKFECERWVALSVIYAFELLGLRKLSISDFEGSWLLERPEPWIITTGSTYALTHEVFYLTNFGEDRSMVPPDLIPYIDCWGPAWISHYLDRNDLDLVGELIIVGCCLDLKWPHDQIAVLTRHQEDTGAIVGPPRAGIQLMNPADTELRKMFLSRYHTTLVGAIAFSMCRKLQLQNLAE